MRSRSILTFSLTCLVLSCGGATPSADTASGQPLTPWDQLDHGGKLERMKTVVVPRMKPVFQELDAQEFAEFGCTSCHGPSAEVGEFDMPNPEIEALDPTDGFKVHRKKHPKETQLMMDRVVPEMAKALGEEPYDPATGKGFGCFECHTKAQ